MYGQSHQIERSLIRGLTWLYKIVEGEQDKNSWQVILKMQDISAKICRLKLGLDVNAIVVVDIIIVVPFVVAAYILFACGKKKFN